MKEYCLFIQNGNSLPYILRTYNNINDAKVALYNIISLEEERRRPFFVDNDFYDNKCSLVSNTKYLCIKSINGKNNKDGAERCCCEI